MVAEVACPSCRAKNAYTAAACKQCGARLTSAGASASGESSLWMLGCAIPVVLGALLLYNCSSGGSDGGEATDSMAIPNAMTAVEARLRDPDSSDFSGMFVAANGKVVCGYVNAANGFGGMTGAQRFAVTSGFAMLEEDGDFEVVWAEYCQRP